MVDELSIEVTRERVVQALCAHYAQDRLTMEELESRLERAQKAVGEPQLAALVVDLPALAEIPHGLPSALPVPAPLTAPPSLRATPSSSALMSSNAYDGPMVRDDLPREDTQRMFTMMGGAERKGAWVPAHEIDCTAIWAGIVLDFREALLPTGVTNVNIFVMMGGVEILVPPGVAVEMNGNALMGAFEGGEDSSSPMPITPHSPIIRVNGFAMMGAVEVSCRYPGESARDAKKRRKAQKRLTTG